MARKELRNGKIEKCVGRRAREPRQATGAKLATGETGTEQVTGTGAATGHGGTGTGTGNGTGHKLAWYVATGICDWRVAKWRCELACDWRDSTGGVATIWQWQRHWHVHTGNGTLIATISAQAATKAAARSWRECIWRCGLAMCDATGDGIVLGTG